MISLSVTTSRWSLVLLGLSVLVSFAAAIDFAVEGHWDGVGLIAVAVLAQVALVARLHRDRRSVALRGDLVSWLADRSAATGEPLEHIADRCVAAYRAGLTPVPGRTDGAHR